MITSPAEQPSAALPFTLFISDLHLSPERPDITECFTDFIKRYAIAPCEALYILGDFFEVWIGDDDQSLFNLQIADVLSTLKARNIPCYFIHGNRDFLLGQRYAKQAGLKLLPEQYCIDLYGKPTLLSHGDEFCTLDADYQRFRTRSRSWWWRALMTRLPLAYRRKLGKKAREQSQMSQQHKADYILDVTPDAIEYAMQQCGVRQLIHGHTHRPATHHHQHGTRYVLGDWYEQGSCLIATRNGIRSLPLPFAPSV